MEKLLEENINGSIGVQKYLCEIVWRNGVLKMDEPKAKGGEDLGPDPHSTLLAALAGCTLATLRMYIERKAWEIPFVKVSLNMSVQQEDGFSTDIERQIIFPESVNEEQRKRLLIIANKCPVSKILENKITIHTTDI